MIISYACHRIVSKEIFMLCKNCFEEVAIRDGLCEDCLLEKQDDHSNEKFEFRYSVKGVDLDVYDMMDIKEYYEAACTAEYLCDNYPIAPSYALELGYKIRQYMEKRCVSEEEAIAEFM